VRPPLHASLIPFVHARSGRALVEFAQWLETVRGVHATAAMRQSHPQGDALLTRQFTRRLGRVLSP